MSVPCLCLVVCWLLVNTNSHSPVPPVPLLALGAMLWCHLMVAVSNISERILLNSFTSSLWQGEWIIAIIMWLLECIASHVPAKSVSCCTAVSNVILSSLLPRQAGCLNMHIKAKGHSIARTAGLGVKLLVARVIRWDLWWTPPWPKDCCRFLHVLGWEVGVFLWSHQMYLAKKKFSVLK